MKVAANNKIGFVVGRAGRSCLRLLRCGLIDWPPRPADRPSMAWPPGLHDAASGRTGQLGEADFHRKRAKAIALPIVSGGQQFAEDRLKPVPPVG